MKWDGRTPRTNSDLAAVNHQTPTSRFWAVLGTITVLVLVGLCW